MATVHWLVVVLAGMVLFSVIPALGHVNLETAPGWARVVLLLGALQGVYLVWMWHSPDWSSVRVVMLVFAVVAALYGAATAVAVATPLDRPMPLDMGAVRGSAARWCTAVLLSSALATYLCGRISAKWQRAVEIDMAGRQDSEARSR